MMHRALNIQLNNQLEKLMAGLLGSRPHTGMDIQTSESAPSDLVQIHGTAANNLPELPPLGSLYNKEDYPDAHFWSKSEWIRYDNRQREAGSSPGKLDFLGDSEGKTVSKERLKSMTLTATTIWATFYRLRQDPHTWMKKTDWVSDYFSRYMRQKYPEFRYCEDNWKVESFAIIKYPDWCGNSRASGTLLRRLQHSFLITK